MVLWDEVVAEVSGLSGRELEVPRGRVRARMITHPQTLDVIVASNLFGDILTDIGSAISGSLGVGPGGNINPERTTPSMFEPIHGSAPDIAGKGIANPIAAIWAGAMMLDHLGERAAHDGILRAIERVIGDERVKTRTSAAAQNCGGDQACTVSLTASPSSGVGTSLDVPLGGASVCPSRSFSSQSSRGRFERQKEQSFRTPIRPGARRSSYRHEV